MLRTIAVAGHRNKPDGFTIRKVMRGEHKNCKAQTLLTVQTLISDMHCTATNYRKVIERCSEIIYELQIEIPHQNLKHL